MGNANFLVTGMITTMGRENYLKQWIDPRRDTYRAGDQAIMDTADHVSKRMPRRYSHIRIEAKRSALESIVKKQTNGVAGQTEDSRSTEEAKSVGYPHRAYGFRNGRGEKSEPRVDCPESLAIAQGSEEAYPQKSPQSLNSKVIGE